METPECPRVDHDVDAETAEFEKRMKTAQIEETNNERKWSSVLTPENIKSLYLLRQEEDRCTKYKLCFLENVHH